MPSRQLDEFFDFLTRPRSGPFSLFPLAAAHAATPTAAPAADPPTVHSWPLMRPSPTLKKSKILKQSRFQMGVETCFGWG